MPVCSLGTVVQHLPVQCLLQPHSMQLPQMKRLFLDSHALARLHAAAVFLLPSASSFKLSACRRLMANWHCCAGQPPVLPWRSYILDRKHAVLYQITGIWVLSLAHSGPQLYFFVFSLVLLKASLISAWMYISVLPTLKHIRSYSCDKIRENFKAALLLFVSCFSSGEKAWKTSVSKNWLSSKYWGEQCESL